MVAQAQALRLLQERQLIPVISDIFPNPTSTKTSNTSSTSSATHSASTPSTTTSSSTSSSSSSTASVTTSALPLTVQTIAGKTLTLTSFAGGQTPTISPSPSPTTTAFLQNKVLSGVGFGLAGLLGLVIIAIATCVIRRRQRRRKLTEEAVSFDPKDLL